MELGLVGRIYRLVFMIKNFVLVKIVLARRGLLHSGGDNELSITERV